MWPFTAVASGGTAMHGHGAGAHALFAFTDAGMHWLLMLAAMMGPVLIEPIQLVRSHSLARRRNRSTLLFLGGYLAIWSVAGVGILTMVSIVAPVGAPPIAAV